MSSLAAWYRTLNRIHKTTLITSSILGLPFFLGTAVYAWSDGWPSAGVVFYGGFFVGTLIVGGLSWAVGMRMNQVWRTKAVE